MVAPSAIVDGGEAAGIPAFMVRNARAVFEAHRRGFEVAVRTGVPIAAGTDAGTPLNPHGSMVPELALMVRYGLSPMDALRAATASAAAALGLEREVGRVAPGFVADLLAVEGDPLADIAALSRVRLVLARGVPVVSWVAAASVPRGERDP